MNKILITGGTGNIGSRLVADMISDGHHVQFTTRSETKAKNFIKKFNLPDKICNPIVLDFKDNNAFDKLELLPTNWGAKAQVTVGPMYKAHVAAAIKERSNPTERIVYSHTGWIEKMVNFTT